MDKILEKLGLRYEDLDKPGYEGERETLYKMLEDAKQGIVTVDRVLGHIRGMRDVVEQELCKPDNDTKKDIYLKARLENYRLLEALLSAPERAQKMLEERLSSLKK